MLKMAPSGVLGSSKSSTYPRGYASGFNSPAALILNILEEREGKRRKEKSGNYETRS
jgi:hypothetical protein